MGSPISQIDYINLYLLVWYQVNFTKLNSAAIS